MNSKNTFSPWITGIGIFASAILLTSCKVGPNYHAPITKVPNTWGTQTPETPTKEVPSVVDTSQPTIAKWWNSFGDPKLDSLVDRAVKSNLDLRLAEARVREARAERGIVKADLLPTVNASASYQRSHNSGNIGVQTSGGTNIINGDLYQAGFDASWEIDVFGRVRRNIEAADADIAAQIEDRRDVLVTLLSEVARNYIELRSFQRQVTIAQANLDAQQETLDLTRIRFNAGLVSDLDVARAEAQVQTTASQIPTFETSIATSIHQLSVLLGQEPNALSAELTPDEPIPPAPPAIPISLPSELLRRRPDIRRAERDLAGATARIGAATADLFPRFSLTGSAGLASTKFSKLPNSGSGTWSILPGVTIPIDFGRIRSNIAVQNAREEQAVTTYEQTVLTSLQEVADSLVAFANEQDRRQKLSAAVDSNQRAVDLADQLYQKGLTDFLTVLQAQRDLYQTQDQLVQSNRDVSSNLVALYKALGGGWEIETETPPPQGKAGNRTVDLSQ
jgi:outer membrane protein, multidrug efflux system